MHAELPRSTSSLCLAWAVEAGQQADGVWMGTGIQGAAPALFDGARRTNDT